MPFKVLLTSGYFITETTLGVSVKAQQQDDPPFLSAFEEVCRLDAARVCQPWLHSETVYNMLPQHRQYIKHRACIRGFIEEVIHRYI